MGNGRDFFARDEQGRMSEFVAIAPSKTVNGIKGTLIKKMGDSDTHTSLPSYANTSNIYFRQNKKGVCQARVYIGQKKYLDFDWSHNHTNKNSNSSFRAGTVHVQTWIEKSDGTFVRQSEDARGMNNAEIKLYGPIIKEFCPHVKLR